MSVEDWRAYMTSRLAPALEVVGVDGVEDVSATAGGLNSQLVRLRVSVAGRPTPLSLPLVVKRTKAGGEAAAAALGTHREVVFYQTLAPVVLAGEAGRLLPRVYYAAVEERGTKVLVLEDLAAQGGVQAGYFFGPGSLHNWGKDIAALTAGFPRAAVNERSVTIEAFGAAARMHARFWREPSLLGGPAGLRAADWVRGEGREGFESAARYAIDAWTRFKEEVKERQHVRVSESVWQMMDHCASTVNFDDYVRHWATAPWTLVHGDFHPANCMVVPDSDSPAGFAVRLLDWEVVGIGSGPQDLGQFTLSHASAATRGTYETEALAAYTSVLRDGLAARSLEAQAPSLERVQAEYVEGGLCRWAWLFPVCAGICPPEATQFFHDQIHDFILQHDVKIQQLGMMRP